ncbi:hypothetical protein C8J56DRAFT_1042093 [Mycena floridula]|nr:hypothetical protein C8J56DRAFT_1042093 [Mycena floridula]
MSASPDLVSKIRPGTWIARTFDRLEHEDVSLVPMQDWNMGWNDDEIGTGDRMGLRLKTLSFLFAGIFFCFLICNLEWSRGQVYSQASLLNNQISVIGP